MFEYLSIGENGLLATLVFQSGKQDGHKMYRYICNNKSADSINVKIQVRPSTNISTKKWMIKIDNKVEPLENKLQLTESIYKITVRFYTDYSNASCHRANINR